MKKGKLSVIGFVSLLLVVASLFLFKQVSGIEKEDINRGSNLSQGEKHELEILMGQISQSLHDGNYGIILDHAVLPNENIEIIVKLGSEVDKKTKKEILQIATDVIKQNGFDSDLFQFNITSFYNSEKVGNHFSQRLSYNDLMGEIMQSLNAKGFDVAVQGKVSSDKNVEISLVLPEGKFDEKTKKEVQQLATDVIEKNNFETEIFQFNITSYINKDD
ncbi:hypothetical protein QTL97_09595 [Sporosarcina thermotolerans]|uniref:Uncharacterized protein n=1 Tax=Sporosarcina thermotolerans TaxID=633404 RepID=A0AAW9AB21_9BACL|nr:hypothetical protein [Sporosarcina thermotolerans]MDW0117190.1 hypothetical protein [Sporosarcina thermotolerans]WHT47359.1 hypothetical protein QNH10_14295 [Sporosarcina thermotolerans]